MMQNFLWPLLLLTTLALPAFAAEFHGLQTVPHWGPEGELSVEVSNWTKMPVTLKEVSVALPGARQQVCTWSKNSALALGPTQRITIVLARVGEARPCLAAHSSLSGVEPRLLRFAALPRLAAASADAPAGVVDNAPTISITARISHRDRLYDSASSWSLQR